MPSSNPILGNFQHAPSSGNARSKYFDGDVVSWEEYCRLKALRHNPYTGQFHKGPQEYSTLHDLKKFRSKERRASKKSFDVEESGGDEDSEDRERCASESDLFQLTSTACTAAQAAQAAADEAFAAASLLTQQLDSQCFLFGADSSAPAYETVAEEPQAPKKSGIAMLVGGGGGDSGVIVEEKETHSQHDAPSSCSTGLMSMLDAISDKSSESGVFELGDNNDVPAATCASASSSPAKRRPLRGHSSSSSAWFMGGEHSDSGSSLDELGDSSQPQKGMSRRRCLSVCAPFAFHHHHHNARRSTGNVRSANLVGMPRDGGPQGGQQHLPLVASMGDMHYADFDSLPFSRTHNRNSSGDLRFHRSNSFSSQQHMATLHQQPFQGSTIGSGAIRHASMSTPRGADTVGESGRSRHFSVPYESNHSSRVAAPSNLNGLGLYNYDGDKPLSDGRNLPWIINRTLSITGRYKIDMSKQGCLGKGAYSLAKICRNRTTDKEFCVKIVKKRMLISVEEKEMIEREVKIHQVLQHRHIIRLQEIFEDETRLFLVLEKADNGNLETLLNNHAGRLPELACHRLFKQLLKALNYLHSNGVLQGDLKPANLLLHRGRASTTVGSQVPPLSPRSLSADDACLNLDLKICDFGLSRKVPDVKFYKFTGDVHKVPFTSMCGTMGYMAPEIMKKEAYTIAVDVWAAGIILFEMISGIKPFVPYADCLTVPLEFPPSIFNSLSSDVLPLLRSMLAVDPVQRITSKHALASEWVSSNFSNLMSD